MQGQTLEQMLDRFTADGTEPAGMSAYYHPDFSPIPKYMVDEKDITTTNDSGQKIFVKNLQAYYEAARPLI